MHVKRPLIGLLLGLESTLALLGVLAVGPLPAAHAATVTVTNTNDDGSGSLREAIASAAPGDTIAFSLTYPATITLTSGELTIAKDLTIAGPGADQLAISGNDSSRVFHISSGEVTLNDLKVTQGTASSYISGGGIYIVNSGTKVTLTQVSVVDNSADDGGGIYLESGSLAVEGGQVVSNTATTSGGGIYINYGKAVLDSGEIRGNTANSGGGVYVGESTVTLSGTEVHGNTSTGSWPGGGGGIYIDTGSAEINTGEVTSNTALYGGGIHIYDGSATLSAGEIRGNTASIGGGGVMIVSSNAAFTQIGTGIISHNSALEGGGVHVRNGSGLLSGGQIISNTADSGGGVYIYEGNTVLDGTEVRGNTATGSWPEGGCGFYIAASGSLVLNGGRIANNYYPSYVDNALYNYGTITTTAALTITGDIYQANGIFNGNNDPLLVEGFLVLDGGTFIAPTDGFELTGEFEHGGGTYQQAQAVTGTTDTGFPKTGGAIINANGQDLDSTTVVIRADTDCTATPGEAVRHCYDITPTNTTNISATITFYFYSGELSGNPCDALNAYRWNGSSWITLTLDTTYGTGGRNCSVSPQSIRVKDVSEFSPFVLKSNDTPTAVTLLTSSTAMPQKGGILGAPNAPAALLTVGLAVGLTVTTLLWRARRRCQ
jgi:hypothetical protein